MRFALESKFGSAPVEDVRVRVFDVPTRTPESDGTLEWRKTTLVVVELTSGTLTGLGYTYANPATARVVQDHLVDVVRGRNGTASMSKRSGAGCSTGFGMSEQEGSPRWRSRRWMLPCGISRRSTSAAR